SIQFETGITGSDVSVTFDVLTKKEATNIEEEIEKSTNKQVNETENEINSQEIISEPTKVESTIHFTPTKKDTIKASFTSLSFLVLVPLIMSFYFQVDDLIGIEEKAEGIIASILASK